MLYKSECEETAYIMGRLYERGLTTCSGGNISCRVDENTIAITPSGKDKARLKPEDIALVTLDGQSLSEDKKLSIETEMHLAVYRIREDVKALVHAHPIHASFYTASSLKLRTDIIAESRFLLGEPVKADYALMGTEDLAKQVAEAFSKEKTSVVLMENHGVITCGDSLFKAFDRIEVLEAAARMTWMSEITGGLTPLTSSRLAEIDQLSD